MKDTIISFGLVDEIFISISAIHSSFQTGQKKSSKNGKPSEKDRLVLLLLSTKSDSSVIFNPFPM